MSNRGKIESIQFTVVYPDGSKKQGSYQTKDSLKALLMDEEFMTPEMKSLFTKSSHDWKLNPAILIVDGNTLGTTCEYPQCQNA